MRDRRPSGWAEKCPIRLAVGVMKARGWSSRLVQETHGKRPRLVLVACRRDGREKQAVTCQPANRGSCPTETGGWRGMSGPGWWWV